MCLLGYCLYLVVCSNLCLLKVGSCSNDDNFDRIFSVLLCVVFKEFYFVNLFLPRKPQDIAENLRFFFHLFVSFVLEFRF